MGQYDFTGAKWGTPILGGSGAQVTWSFAQSAGAFFSFDSAIAQVTYQNLIRDAFQAWENVANIDFVEVGDTATSKIRLGWDAIDGQRNTIGEAAYTYNYGSSFNQLIKSEIRFDTAEDWTTAKHYVAGAVNFYAVAIHEIGHALGLNHSDERDTIMYPSIGTVVTLTPGDIAGAQALYGAKNLSSTPALTTFIGTTGADVYMGTAAHETIYGNAGNDRLTGAGGHDRVDGGAGIDVAVFSGRMNHFGVTRLGTDEATVVDLRSGSPEGTDTLIGIERLSFSDGTLAFDLAGTAGQAYRLYKAVFDRTPDTEGLGYWIRQMDAGRGDLTWVANNFQLSDEFRTTYGGPATLSSSDFVGQIYSNVLDRAPDAQGYSYWVTQLDQGLSRARLLASFSESPENQQNVVGTIGGGIWFV